MLAAYKSELLSVPGVVGIAEGEADGRPCLVVLVERPLPGLPTELAGYPVRVRESGPLTAL